MKPIVIRTADQMRELGTRLAGHCQPGDVLVLNGDLAAGKTTLVQGIGLGLGVREPITSPTFVISRVHPADSGLHLIHVDAYRLGSGLELDDLDLDAELATGVIVIEWGQEHAHRLSEERLEVGIEVLADGSRLVTMHPVGKRWLDADVCELGHDW